ncbi:uncharacterized protein LOC126560618 [Anopheles maculipalpis]|uniref:uncharacterized protein LOC126560618 n=1 Tax=Anopheles maculipalpis TaxID=1496333 RepID=UPI002158EAF0|nr:uncharacterized protein LOC126560618 [Anopheles maculipalpis]
MQGYEIVYHMVDYLRDVTYDVEIGNTIARRHNATFNRMMYMFPEKCIDYYYSPMYEGEGQYVPLPDKSELCFIVPKSAPKSVFLVLLDPYDRFSWIAFGLTVIAISLVLFWLAESARYTSIMLIVLEMLMIVLHGPTHQLIDRFERFVVGLFMLLSIVVLSGYQSLVISFMSSPRYNPQLDTFDAINDTCLFMYDVKLSSLGFKFKNVHRTYEVFDSTELMWQMKWCSLVTCTEAAYIMAHVGDVDEPAKIDPGEIALYNEEEWKQLKNQLKYFRYSKARIQSMTAMYLVTQDSPARHHLARYAQAFIEGRLEYFPVLKKSKPKPRIISEDTIATISVRQMDMKALLIAWILYCGGIMLSTVSFLAEHALVCMRKIKRFLLKRYIKRRKCNKTLTLEECGEDVDSVTVRKQHSKRSDCVRTDAFLAGLQQRATAGPGVGIRALARDVGVAPSTVKVALNEDLRYASYKRHQKHNVQNNRWLAYCAADVPRVPQTKFPQPVMVFRCVSSEGDVMPPHIFPQGLRLNADGYIDLLATVVKPWIETVANGLPYVRQQDSAPCHTAVKTRQLLLPISTDSPPPTFGHPARLTLNLWIILC